MLFLDFQSGAKINTNSTLETKSGENVSVTRSVLFHPLKLINLTRLLLLQLLITNLPCKVDTCRAGFPEAAGVHVKAGVLRDASPTHGAKNVAVGEAKNELVV